MDELDQSKLDNQPVAIQKKLARTHLLNDRIEDAIAIYADILWNNPNDLDSMKVFGDLYLASQDYATAVSVYSKCVQLAPDELDIANRLRLASLEKTVLPPEENPFEDAALTRLLQRLENNHSVVKVQDLERASELIEKVLRSENPGKEAADHLSEIEELLPALLELNIQQSRAVRRPDLETALRQILQSFEPAKVEKPEPKFEIPELAKIEVPTYQAHHFSGNVGFMTPDPANLSLREDFIYRSLVQHQCTVQTTNHSPMDLPERPDAVIVCNPQINPWLLEGMAACTAAHVPLIVDMDGDFDQLPYDHPDYAVYGLGSATNARAYTAALLLANLVTVPSEEMAVSFHKLVHNVMVVEEGWSKLNPLWLKPTQRRSTLNIGWVGKPGQFEDMLEIRRILIRVIREFMQTQLIIAGDPEVYHIFESLPEHRRLYLPPASEDDFPYLLGQIDILVHPLRSIPYNLTLPDTLLMEAGVKQIPWIASPIASTLSWKQGGLVADTLEEWHTDLRQMVMDADLRKKLGDAGFKKAQLRELNSFSTTWVEVIEQAINLCSWPSSTTSDHSISVMDGKS